MKKLLTTGLLMAVAVILLNGCSSPPTAGTKIVRHPSTQIIENNYILKKTLKITKLDERRVNGLMQIQIEAENMTSRDYQFEYQVRWLDKNGYEFKGPLSTWRSVHAVAKDVIRMSGIAPSEKAEDFEFIVRFPDRF